MSWSLLEALKSLIERTYGMPPLMDDVGRYVIGDRGLRALYGHPGDGGADGARLLVRESRHGIRATLYYPDALVRHLERHNPLDGLGDVNIQEFAVLIEELDHLLTVAHRAAQGRRVSRLELEHHAAVTKYLVVVHFLGRQLRRRRLPEVLRLWVRHQVLGRYSEGSGESAARYREAARLAHRYLAYLEALPAQARRQELLAFHRRSFQETRRLIVRGG